MQASLRARPVATSTLLLIVLILSACAGGEPVPPALGKGVNSIDDVGPLMDDLVTPSVLSVDGRVVRIAFLTDKCRDRFLLPARVAVRRSGVNVTIVLQRASTDGCGTLEDVGYLRVLKVVLARSPTIDKVSVKQLGRPEREGS